MLFVDRRDLDTFGQLSLQLLKPSGSRRANLDHVSVCQRRHPEGEGRGAVLPDDLTGLFRLVAGDAGDVTDRNLSDLSGRAKP